MSHYVNRFPRPKLSQEQIEEEKRLRALLQEQEADWDEEDQPEGASNWQAPQTPEEDEAMIASLKRLIEGG